MRAVPRTTYGTIYGTVKRTTVYLPDDLKGKLEQMAAASGRSEAELIREALERLTEAEAPRPRLPLFVSGDPIAHRVDQLLSEGFGLD